MRPVRWGIDERESEKTVKEIVKADIAAVRGQHRVADVELELVARQFRFPGGFRHAALLITVESVDISRLHVEIGVPTEKRPFAFHVATRILVTVLAVRHVLESHVRPNGAPDQVAVGQAVVESDVRHQRGEQRLHRRILVGRHPHAPVSHSKLVSHGELRPDVGHDGELVVKRVVELELQREEHVVDHRVMVKLVVEPKVRVVKVGAGRVIEVGLEVEHAERPESQPQRDAEIAEMVREFNAVLAPEARQTLHVWVVGREGGGQHQLGLGGQPDAEAVVPNRDLHRRIGDSDGIFLSTDRSHPHSNQQQKTDKGML